MSAVAHVPAGLLLDSVPLQPEELAAGWRPVINRRSAPSGPFGHLAGMGHVRQERIVPGVKGDGAEADPQKSVSIGDCASSSDTEGYST